MKKLILKLLRSETFSTGFSLAVGLVVLYFANHRSEVALADNTLLTISMITREALRILENNLAFTKRINRQDHDKFAIEGAKIGYVVNARKPVRYTVATGQALSLQDATETQVPVSLTTQDHVDFQFSSADLKLSIDDFGDRFIQPAVSALANKIDYNGLQLYKQVWNAVGTPATTPILLLTYLMAGVALDNNAAPQDEQRYMVITPKMQAYIVDALKGLYQQANAIGSQYIKGQMGTAVGFAWAMDQNCPTHTVGTYTGSPVVNGANQTGASLITSGWGSGVTSLKKGDIFTIDAVRSVNPQSRQSTGELQTFVVTADISDTAGAITILDCPRHHGVGRVPDGRGLASDQRGHHGARRDGRDHPAGAGVPSRRVHARHGGPAGAEGHGHGLARLGQAVGHFAPHRPRLRHHHGPIPVSY